ncbi:tripartite tricarboxylate transporter substrate binding protein [Thioclava kandeliae]|uniref:Tripartite tricarboxylate transporter substrate binding protein n=1 Tax=Thioclava kandeliae TaxID=3070818 RepID=A0ABV1SHH7_9RHOB
MSLKTFAAKLVIGLAGSFALSSATYAEGYPPKPVQVIVPVGAGGDTDLNARLFSRYMEKELGQSFVIVNVKGAGGTIGMKRVRDADPDGQTVLFYHNESMIPELMGMSDITLSDFEMAGIGVLDNTTVLAVSNDAPYKSLADFSTYAKAHPGEVEFAILTGGYPHLVGLALEEAMGIKLNMVDVGGNSAKMVALKGKKTDMINIQYGLARDYFASGDFVSLGLLSPERNPLIPDVVTTAEEGYPLAFNKFFFYAMPEGTPEETVEIFSAAMKRVVENPDYQAEAEKIFVTPTWMSPADSAAYAAGQREIYAKYADLLKQGN